MPIFSTGLSWTPAQLTTALWLDAADSATLTLNGSNVSQWNDKSGNGRHASQATAGKQPEFFANGKNNLGMIYFDGGNDIMLIASTPLFSSSKYADISIFAAYKFKMTSGQYGEIFGNYLSGNLEFMGGGQAPYITPWGIWNDQSLDLDSGDYTQNLDWIVSAVRASSVWTGYTNGTTKNSLTNYVSVYTGANTESIWSIGAATNEGEFGKFDLYEIICVDGTVSAENRQRIEGYLAWKWGLTANLPSDHPYKTTALTTKKIYSTQIAGVNTIFSVDNLGL